MARSRSAAPGIPFGQIAGVGGDARADDPLAHVLQGGQAQVLAGGDVAEEVGPGHGGHGAADGRGDVVVARADVFVATWVVQLILGVGVKLVMDPLGATPDVRTYLGATLTRGGSSRPLVFWTWRCAG